MKKNSKKIQNLKTGEPGRQVQSFQIFGKHYVGMSQDIKTTKENSGYYRLDGTRGTHRDDQGSGSGLGQN